jgi:murein L,D-transpeptidase YafK
MKLFFSIFLSIILSIHAVAQMMPPQPNTPIFPDNSFYNGQMSFDKVRSAMAKYEPKWKELFKEKKLNFPNTNIYIRNFKNDQKLEIWARNTTQDTFTLLKTFDVCVLSGKMGPKRKENDYQVPEGFYFLDEYNAKSNYYLSLLVSYPNYSDLLKGDKNTPGGEIYIHGSCVTVGCIPMTDDLIQEIYTLTVLARTNGQLNIPVHIFPTRFTRQGLNYLGQFYKDNDNQKFWISLKKGYDYFETYRKIQPVMYDTQGNYIY